MKILAIRGRNLASLVGDFEVDLQKAPLSGEGLFAITGQTGSGKSTLLDAMCLALFDKTPRLQKGDGSAVGRDEEDKKRQVGNSDPRALLRNGTAEGMAEVDFLGVDERSYRATWTVRRSRGLAGGRLQQSRLELLDLAEQKALTSDKKGETLALIAARLGLEFEQFRRSVLLPQGEFAAFLKASEQERGDLLERMTGTEIYKHISMAAFARSKQEREELQRLEDRLSVLSLLEPSQVTALSADLQAARAAASALEAGLSASAQAVAWHGRRTELSQAEAAAQAALSQAQGVLAALAPVVAELAAVSAVEALRPLLEGRDRTRAAVAQAQQEVGVLRGGLQSAEDGLRQAEQAARATEDIAASVRIRQEVMGETLKQADVLDAELAALGRAVASAHRETREAEGLRDAASQQVASLEARQREAQDTEQQASAWLAASQGLRRLAEGWEGWQRLLEQGAAVQEALSGADGRRAALAGDVSAAEQARSALQERLSAAEAELAPLREQIGQMRAALAETSGTALQEQQRLLQERRDRLQRLAQLRQRLLDLEERCAQRTQATAQARGGAAEARSRGDSAEERRKQVSWMLVEAERVLEWLRDDEVLTARRLQLQAGQPCPLCGAESHPFHGAPRPMAAMFQQQHGKVQELRGEQAALALAVQQSQADVVRLEEEAAKAAAESAALASRISELGAEWSVAAAALALPAPAEAGAGAGHVLVVERGRVEQELEAVGDALRVLAQRQAALATAEQAREALAERRDGAAAALRGAEARAEQAARALEGFEAACARSEAQWQEIAAALAEPLAGVADWREALRATPAAFVARCAAQAGAYQAAQARGAAAQRALAEARPALEAARERLQEREAGLRRIAAGRLEQDAQMKEVQARRMRLLGGQGTEAVRAALKKELAGVEKDQRDAAQLREGAAQRVTGLQARLESATAEAARRIEEAEAAAAALDAGLAARGARLEDVQARLQRPLAWVTAERARVQAAQGQVAQAQAVREERLAQLQRHLSEGEPPLSAEAAQTELARLFAEREAVHQQVYRLQGLLTADRESREQAAALLAQRDQQRAVWERWEVMNKLIGSATGRAFSQFAQSLTLDALITQANSHLRGLSQRYSLMRVPAEDLLLQIVDHYHGDEVRSVNSLSGGESFLVSLALALGLATLSARDTRISSLFIDEGFGTLDPDTLDVALSSLDALQASGRQVGLISHIPGMAERVGVQVQILPRGGGRSVVRVVGG